MNLNKNKLISLERILITLAIIILMGASFFAGIQVCKLYNELRYFNFSYVDNLNKGAVSSVASAEVTVNGETHDDIASSSFVIKTNLMLNWVINCESSGRHEDIWGNEGEYGILQFKDFSFDWLSEKYNFTGDWKNQDDQIELFLLTSEADKITHWSCFRKWLNYKNNNQLNE